MTPLPPSPDEPSPDQQSPDEQLDRPVETTPEPRLLTSPADGLPPLVETAAGLAQVVAAMERGTGPVAVDAERAHGFRYSQRAYLIQLRRAGSGTHLIDPVAVATDQHKSSEVESGGRPQGRPAANVGPEIPADLGALSEMIIEAEWIVHAATQDLPCLVEIGLVPQRLFDTELAGRLLGYPRVNLGTLIEELFEVRLLKEHSAADWSVRPLPPEWLTYAALDVELLVELREAMAAQLEQSGKAEWARQEFAWLVENATRPREPRIDPWRRTSGIHRIRTSTGLAIVEQLWQTRDAIARRTDRAPGRLLPDAAIVDLASQRSPSRRVLQSMPAFAKRTAKRYETNWLKALDAALDSAADELPPLHRQSDAPPQARIWASRDPVAAARLHRIRGALIDRAAELSLPIENLLTPEFVRRLAWTPPTLADEASVDAFLAEQGARLWQREIAVPLITPLLPDP